MVISNFSGALGFASSPSLLSFIWCDSRLDLDLDPDPKDSAIGLDQASRFSHPDLAPTPDLDLDPNTNLFSI